MKNCFLWLVEEERTTSERVVLLLLSGILGFLLGMVVSPFRKIIVGSYNGSYNGSGNEGNYKTRA